jgi:uncharacterized protein (TIGR02147 family)
MLKRIEQYDNYREFLGEYYIHQKKILPVFSYRMFCKRAKISSPSFYKEVVDGKRDLTPNMIDAFARGIKLTASDKRYFKALVGFNQSRSLQEKQLYLEQMHALRRRVRQQVIPLDYYEYFSKWYNPVIRELACIVDWDGDYSKLARMVVPPIHALQARESIELLMSMGFLCKNENGRYEHINPAVTAGKDINDVTLCMYNKTMAEHGGNAIEAFPRHMRIIRSMTIGVSQQSYDLISEEIQGFAERIIRIVDDDKNSDCVYTLNMQLFPVSTTKPCSGNHENTEKI